MGDTAEISVETDVAEAEDEWVEPATPAARLWARLFDTWLFSLLIGAGVGLLFPALFERLDPLGRLGDTLVGVLVVPFALLVDAALMALFGTTPGKLLAGIRVETLDGRRVGQEAFARNARVYIDGLWLGLPLLNLIGMSRARNRLLEEGATRWDEKAGTRVVERGSNELRTAAVAILALGINFGMTAFGKYAEFKRPEWDRADIVAALPRMNEGLPRFLDDITRLDRIDYRPEENILNIEHRLIHHDGSPVEPREMAGFADGRAALLPGYCADAMKPFRDRDVPVRYRYRDHEGHEMLDVMFHRADCDRESGAAPPVDPPPS